jgi:O-antigen/teichoic acid export membrane protein
VSFFQKQREEGLGLKRPYRDIVKHSFIYGLGHILGRLASLVLLPLYTKYLSPSEYGCIAVLDLASGLISALLGAGVAAAVNRRHFETQEESAQDRIWWTGESFVFVLAFIVIVAAWPFREALAQATLGNDWNQGSFYYSLVLLTIFFSTINQVPLVYLRARKWSGIAVSLSFANLLFSIFLNIYFVVVLGKGVGGILLSNLLSSILLATALITIFARTCGRFTFHWPLVGELLRFGLPLMTMSILALAMHEADRYLLAIFLDMKQVGVYAVAYKIGQAVEQMIHAPFASIWVTTVYEVADRADAKEIYVRVFHGYVAILLTIMLGVSFFARPLLSVMTTADYVDAVYLIPLICLGYVFFSLSEHFRVPALLHHKTLDLVPTSVVAVIVNVVSNCLLIPLWGLFGAAVTSLVTYAVYSLMFLYVGRKIDRIDYAFSYTSKIFLGVICSYVCFHLLESFHINKVLLYSVAVGFLAAWIVVFIRYLVSKENSLVVSRILRGA